MSEPTLPLLVEGLVALLLLASGVLALSAALGLWRLADIFRRLHAPSLTFTLGTWCVALASLLYFSFAESTLSLHVGLIVVLLALTVPVTTLLLARAALLRLRRAEGPAATAGKRARGDLPGPADASVKPRSRHGEAPPSPPASAASAPPTEP